MRLDDIKNYPGGWVVGDFIPAITNRNIEIGIKKYKKGETNPAHLHKFSDEINIIVEGSCEFLVLTKDLQLDPAGSWVSYALTAGGIIVIHRNEAAEFTADTDCALVVIKTASVPGDKYPVDKTTRKVIV